MPDAGPTPPTANPAREVIDTKLAFDVTAKTATASITLGASDQPGATLEVGDLMIDSVQVAGTDLPYMVAMSKMDLGLPAGTDPVTVDNYFRVADTLRRDGRLAQVICLTS